MRNYARFQYKIEVSRTISVIKDLTCLVEKSPKASMKNDMLDFNVIKFFCINIHNGKVLSPGWVKISIDGVARGYTDFVICGGIFRESMG